MFSPQLQPQYTASPRWSLRTFSVPTIPDNEQDNHLAPQNTQSWALDQGAQWNFYLPFTDLRLQAS